MLTLDKRGGIPALSLGYGHKMSRGFLPVRTWSAHWIADEGWRKAIARFLRDEREVTEGYLLELSSLLLY